MAVQWERDVDAALAEAGERNKPLLLDFSAAPG
ncbi:MAG: thioredoxin family protein [Nitrospirae bacterium]|nr:thioredoxin family protein [Nitrospirota bacterium]